MRLDRGLTQIEVAKKVGVTEGTVVNWELGHFGPDLRATPRVINWLGYDPRPPGQSLAEQIRWLREARGLSQAEFAEKLKVDPSTVSLWENGETEPMRENRELLEFLIEVQKSQAPT
jgi:transcriptional regulator with XRE-family HTH domain